MRHETPDRAAQQSVAPSQVENPSTAPARTEYEAVPEADARKLRRLAARFWLAALLLLLAALLTACGTLGSNSFSGGGVPIGGSRVFGRVVSAANTSLNLSNVEVDIDATPEGGTTRSLQTTTGPDGSFTFSNVLPGFSNGTLTVTATPADPGYRAHQISLSVANGRTKQMIVTLPPASFDSTTAQSVALALASPAIPSGTSAQLQTVVRDAAGNPLPVKPILVFDGNFGSLEADGTFTVPAGTLSGMGSITAYWYRLQPQTQQIRVDDTAPPQPPSPPILPTPPMPKFAP